MGNSKSIADNEPTQTGNEDIVLTGDPDFLYGRMHLSNKSGDTLFVNEIPLTHDSELGFPDHIRTDVVLRPNSEKTINIRIRLPRHTPAGTYGATAKVGAEERKISFVVHENKKVEIQPKKIFLDDATPGKVYKSVVKVFNLGNSPVKIHPAFKHSVMLDNHYICKSLAVAIAGKGKEGFMSVLDNVISVISTSMAKSMKVDVKETGHTIDPGSYKEVHVTFTLPPDIEPHANYSGNLNVAGNKEIAYFVSP